MTEDEQTMVKAVVDGWRHEPRVECPACGVPFTIRIKVTAGAVRLDTDAKTPPTPQETKNASWETDLTPSEQRLLREADDSGLLLAFKQAVEDEKAGMVPGNIGKFLLLFLRNARLDTVPRFVLDEYLDQFAPERLEFYSSQGIFAVTAGGVIRAFFPKSRFLGRRVKAAVAGALSGSFQSDERMVEWVRGRFGYVPRDARAFSQAMRHDNIGQFGRLVQ